METKSVPHNFVWKKIRNRNCDDCGKGFFLSYGYECQECAYFLHKGCIKNVPQSCRLRSEIYLLSHSNQLSATTQSVLDEQEKERFFKLNGITKDDHVNQIFYTTIDRRLVALDDEGQAFSINIESFPDEPARVKPMKFLPTKQIVQVCAGANHTVFLTNNGHVYSLGSNQYGQLGVGKETTDSQAPVMVTSLLSRIVEKVSCGGHHSIALTIDNEIFTWGLGENGRLGNCNEENQFHPVTLRNAFKFPFEWEDSTKPSHRNLTGDVTGASHHDISGRSPNSSSHIVLSQEGGNGDHDILQDNTEMSSSPRSGSPRAPQNPPTTFVSSKRSSRMLSDEETRRLFQEISQQQQNAIEDSSFNNEIEISTSPKPDKVTTYTKPIVSHIACGFGHTLVLFRCQKTTTHMTESTDGIPKATTYTTRVSILFTFGKSDFGQCGHGNLEDVRAPKIVEGLEGRILKQVSGGFYHSAAITEEGEAYCFGACSEGQCGPIADPSIQSHSSPLLVSVPFPITSLTCGNFHNIVQTTNGEVYVWGRLFNSSHFIPTVMEKFSGRKIISMISGMLSTIVVIADAADSSKSPQDVPEEVDPAPDSPRNSFGSPPTAPLNNSSSSSSTSDISSSFTNLRERGASYSSGLSSSLGNIFSAINPMKNSHGGNSHNNNNSNNNNNNHYHSKLSGSLIVGSPTSPLDTGIPLGGSPPITTSSTTTGVFQLNTGSDSFWTPFTNLDDSQQLTLNIRKGIPDNKRQKVWLYISGCTELLAANDHLYADAIKEVYHVSQDSNGISADVESMPFKLDEHLADLSTAVHEKQSSLQSYFPPNFSFATHSLNEEIQERAERLLYVLYKKDLPEFVNCHCILPDLVCILLHYISEEQAYFTIHSLFGQIPKMAEYLHYDCAKLFSPVILSSIRMYAPDLFDHVNSLFLDMESATFASSWFSRLFVGKFPYKIILRIFDCFISEGIIVLYRVAIAVFLMNTTALLKCQSGAEVIETLDHFMANCKDEDVLFEVAYGVSLRRCVLIDNIRSARDSLVPSIQKQSTILDWEQMATLWLWLPARFQLQEPTKLFGTDVDGFNLHTLVGRCGQHSPTLLILKTSTQHIFGAYITATWENTSGFQGTGESFLFSLAPKIRKYSWTKDNSCFFMLSNGNLIIGGGGGGCGIRLDDELFHGSSDRCSTFDNQPLNGDRDFECVSLEVYALND